MKEPEKDHDKGKKRVKIDVDNHPEHVEPKPYVVSDLKKLVGVPEDKDLDQVIAGNLTTLDDASTVSIIGGEIFFSHVRRGGSS
jgi:hypothetical protein